MTRVRQRMFDYVSQWHLGPDGHGATTAETVDEAVREAGIKNTAAARDAHYYALWDLAKAGRLHVTAYDTFHAPDSSCEGRCNG